MPKTVEVPDFGTIEFPDEMGDQDITTAIREQVYKLPALPPMAEYDEPTYKDRLFISENNLRTADEDFAKQAMSFEQMVTELQTGKAITDEATVLEARRSLQLAKTRREMALEDFSAVQKDPAPLSTSFAASVARGGLNTAAAAVEAKEELGESAALRGKPFNPADQEKYDFLRDAMEREDLSDFMSQEGGGAKLPSNRSGELFAQLRELEKPPRGTTLQGQLAGAAAETFENRNINPNAPNVGAQIGRGAGTFFTLSPALLAGGASIPLAAAQAGGEAYESAYTMKERELRAHGESDESLIREAASMFASKEAIKTVPSLAAYLLGGKIAASVVTRLLPGGSSLLRGLAGGGAALGANVGVGGALRKFEGQNFTPTVEQLTQDALFAIMPGIHEARRPPKPTIEEPSNAQQISETSAPDGGVRPRGEVPVVSAEEGGAGIQPGRQGERVVEQPRGEAPQTIEEIAAVNGVKYDGPTELPGKPHQFTDQRTGSTFIVLGEVTPEKVQAKVDKIDESYGHPPRERNFGPGAASAQEPVFEQTAIGAKNASVDAQRAERGLPPLMSEGRKANPEVWAAVEKRVETDPEFPSRVVNEIENGTKKSVTDEEQTSLLWRMIDLRNQRDVADQRALDEHTYSPEERARFEEQANAIEAELQRTEEADRGIGTKTARALQIRKLMANEDFSLAAMERRARKAKGDTLTPEERTKIRQEAEGIQQTQKALEEREAKLQDADSLAAAREALAKAAKIHPKVLEYAEGVVSRWETEAIKARQDIREAMGLASANPLQFKVAAAAFKIARAKVARGLLDLTQFTREMITEFGEGISNYIKPAWDRAIKAVTGLDASKTRKKSEKQVKEEGKAAEEAASTEAGIRAMIEGGAKDLETFAPKIIQLGNEYARAGASVEGVEAKLFDIFKGVIPDVTSRQLRDTWSTYGKSKAATTDPEKVAQAQRRGEAQKMSALEDLIQKRAALKTGQQRPEMSERYRQLTKQINEKKKELGIVDGDPAKRLKTALESMEKRAQNRINDLRFEISRGERIVRQKGESPTSPKLEALRKELAGVQAEHDSVFGKRQMTDEQRLKNAVSAAKRAEERANAELANARKGIFTKPAAKGVTRSAELDAIRARTVAAREERKALEDAANPPMSKAQKQLDAALVARERWEQVLAGEITPSKKVPREALTQLEEDARAEIAAMRELAAEMKRDARPKADPEVAQIKALERAAEEYERRLKEADFTGRGRTQGADTARVAAARAVRDAAKAAFDAAKAATKPKRTPEEIAIQNKKASLARSNADVAERLAKGDFAKRPRKELDVSKDPEAVRLKAENERIKAEFQRQQKKWEAAEEWKQKNVAQKIGHGIKLGWQAIRNLKLSMDLTATIQTAAAMAARPIQGVKAIGQGIRVFIDSFFRKQSQFAKQLEAQIELNPNNQSGLYKQMGLDIRTGEVRDENATSVLERLADLENNWAGVPDVVKGLMNMRGKQIAAGTGKLLLTPFKVIGRGLRASNESFQAIANAMRSVTADSILKNNFKDAAPTKQQAEVIGNYVNAATGSGGLRKTEGARAILFAPNWYLSIIKYLSGQPFWKAAYRGEGKAARIIATEYVRALATLGVLLGARQLFFGDDRRNRFRADELLDPSAGSVRLPSGVTIDLTQGRAQWASLAARMITGKKKVGGQVERENPEQALLGFFKGRLSQEIRTGLALVSQKDYYGKPLSPAKFAQEVVTPLSWKDVDRIIKAEGMTKGSFLQLMNFIFGNVKPPRKQ